MKGGIPMEGKNFKDAKASTGKKNYKSRRGNGRNSNRSKGRIPESDYETGSNSPAWYATDPALLRDAASIAYSWAIGTPVDMGNPITGMAKAACNLSIPGILALSTTPTIGYSDDPSSPINIAALSTYTFVRHANSGHTNYDAPDLMIYIMACGSVYSYINYLQRAYGIATLFSQKNRYLPDSLLRIQGIDSRSIQKNLAQFRYGINMLINKAASFAAPATMPIFNRMAFMYQNIYCEGESIKDQLYLYKPSKFLKFAWDANNKGCLQLAFPTAASTLLTATELLEFGDELLDAMRYDEDLNIMSGDILKAYGSAGIIKLASLPVDYTVMPVASLEVLEQMKNATAVGEVENYSISQDATNAFLVSTPTVKQKSNTNAYKQTADGIRVRFLCSNRLLTTMTNEPTPEQTMVNTRLMTTGFDIGQAIDGPNLWYTVKLHCGSEIVTDMTFCYFGLDASNVNTEYLSHLSSYVMYYADATQTDIENDSLDLIQKLSFIQNFKFSPFVKVTTYKNGITSPAVKIGNKYIQCFDVDNYAVLDDQDVAKLHETALVNMLHVPSIAKVSKAQ